MFIQTEQTPNPATLKFLPGRTVMESGTADFPGPEKAEGKSPLAERLFQVDGVAAVFFGSDFVTVTKVADKEWYLLKPAILGAFMEHFTAGKPVLHAAAETPVEAEGEDGEIVDQIKERLDTRVRQAVAQDGGDIILQGFDKGVVYLTKTGACTGRPRSTATM